MKKIAVFFLLLIAGFWIINTGINRMEQNECRRWTKADMTQQWQIDQCAHHQIIIK